MDRHRARGLARSAGAALLALLLAVVTFGGSATAATPAWATLESVPPAVDFGSSVVFDMQAQATRPPVHAWLVFSLEGERALNRADAEFDGTRTIDAQWTWELEPGMLSPGTTVNYYWELEDEQGRRVKGAEGSFRYEDSRFGWESVENGGLAVFFYRNRDDAEDVLAAGAAALERIAEGTGMEPLRTLRVYIYSSQRDMSLAIPSRSETFDARTVTLGMSMGSDALVLLGADPGLLETTAHELSHAVINQNTDSPFADIPRWLDEGLAMYAEGVIPTDNARDLATAVRQGKLISLRSMTSYPGDSGLVDLYYGQAYSVAEFMVQTYGSPKMRDLLALLRDGVSIDEALVEAYGMTFNELESAWLADLGVSVAPVTTPTPGAAGRIQKKTEATAVPEAATRTGSPLPCPSTMMPGAVAVVWFGGKLRRAA